MRYYGYRSGRNKPAAYFVRGLMWQKRKTANTNTKKTDSKRIYNERTELLKHADTSEIPETELSKQLEECYRDNKSVSEKRNYVVGFCILMLVVGIGIIYAGTKGIANQTICLAVGSGIAIVSSIISYFICNLINKNLSYMNFVFDEDEYYDKDLLNFLRKLCGHGWINELEGNTRGVNPKLNYGTSKRVKLNENVIKKVSSNPIREIICNRELYSISSIYQRLIFLPRFIIVQRNSEFRTIGYKDISIACNGTSLISEETIPGATITGKTWKYANKKGGPDKRYNNNYQINTYLLCMVLFYASGLDVGFYLADRSVFDDIKALNEKKFINTETIMIISQQGIRIGTVFRSIDSLLRTNGSQLRSTCV